MTNQNVAVSHGAAGAVAAPRKKVVPKSATEINVAEDRISSWVDSMRASSPTRSITNNINTNNSWTVSPRYK